MAPKLKKCGCSSMVEFQPSKLAMRVRFPLPAPIKRFKVNSWGETFEKCFAPAFLMGLNKMLKK